MIHDLKKKEQYKKIPIIVFSTLRAEVDGARYRAMGVADYINKPSSYSEYLKIAEYVKSRIVA